MDIAANFKYIKDQRLFYPGTVRTYSPDIHTASATLLAHIII